MLVLGHRGAPWEATENTLESFALARVAGADGIELDVRLCATGEVVCCHDVTLHRLAKCAARVRATGWDVLRRYDLGRGARLCTLDEALDLWSAHGVVNVELKADDVDLPALAEATVRVIERARRCAVVVSSFDPAALEAVLHLRPRLARGQLVPPMARPAGQRVLAAMGRARPHAIHPWHGDASPARVAAWRARGLDVHVWTVDNDVTARALREAGATSIITNAPAAMLRSIGVERDDPRRGQIRDRLLQR
jgi:glycerophosphoryl diester phosphodiesterase